MTNSNDVHITHCCAVHGCKYGDEDCPVVNLRVKQAYPCEDCVVQVAPATVHTLKLHPEPFAAVVEGRKRYEVRNTTDRNYQIGDILVLREYIPETEMYTGEEVRVSITYMTPPGSYGLPENLAVLSIA